MSILNKMKMNKEAFLSGFTILFLTLFLLLAQVTPIFAFDIPKPTDLFYVNDTVDLLSAENEDYIVTTNEELYDKTGAQIVVVTIQSLDGSSIEEYSTELFRKYGIGNAEKNNGLLFLLSLDDRECRIEVGYGLEGTINDAKAGRIMDKYMIPYFKDGNWEEGIINGFDALLDEVCEEYAVEVNHNEVRSPSGTTTKEEDHDDNSWGIIFAGIISLIGGLLMGYLFPGTALIPGLIFLVAELAIAVGVFDGGDLLFAILLDIVAYILGWGITSPDPGGGYSGGSSSSYSSSSRSSSSGSSSRNYGGGGRSGGGGASRKF